MPKFSEKSLKKLDTCHPYLQLIMNELIQIYDVTILEGHRGENKQNNYFAGGKSKLKYPDSRHNRSMLLNREDLSDALDIVPWHKKDPHIRWNDVKSFYYMIGIVKGIAFKLNIKIRSGSDWDRDTDFTDQTFNDLPHFELEK